MTAKTLMIQGTASSVGKSVLVAALCRILRQDGFKVAPFKSQNMALNSFVTTEGGEIGRAQAVQAEAAGILPSIYMNPVLLKPEADAKSQVIVLGKVVKTLKATEYYDYTPNLLQVIEDSLNRLRSSFDVVVIEGAGSPAEINLHEHEIVNMRIARMADAPVLLVGDIDRGGVFASIIGTLELLTQEERAMVRGLVINKFRGDLALLKPGLDVLEQKTKKPVLGVVPYFRGIGIAQEDSVYLDERYNLQDAENIQINVIRLPHISNYDDFDPLEEMGCTLRYVTRPAELSDGDLIIIPGTKSTISDLLYLRQQELDKAIIKKSNNGSPVIGICGGYQMLGKTIRDPYQVESIESSVAGLGLLDIETIFNREKTTSQIKAKVVARGGLFEALDGTEVTGYEIHMGQTEGKNTPVFQITETPEGKADYFDGTVGNDYLVSGTYIHGLFHNHDFATALINWLRQRRGLPSSMSLTAKDRDKEYDKLALIVRQSLNMPEIFRIIMQK